MGRRKMNIFPWSAGLAIAMAALCLVGAAGVSYARYQVNRSESVFYTPQQPAQVYLGEMVTRDDGQTVFDSRAVGSWETVENRSELAFAVANGTSSEDYSQKDQLVQLRLIGSLGVWDGQQTVNVTLCVPSQDQTDENQPQFQEIPGVATRIPQESPLYHIFGDGWMFTFLDENIEETTWLLEGESFSVLQFRIVIEGVELTDPSLFQLTATGAYMAD